MSEKTEISVTRALAELKILDSRISSALSVIAVVDAQKDGKLSSGKTEEEFKKDAKATVKSVEDLIQRRSTIKRAIVLKNATTEVTIAGVTMTVAEAVEQKASINYKIQLRDRLVGQLRAVKSLVERDNVQTENALSTMLTQAAGSSKNVNQEELSALTETFKKSRMQSLFDPTEVQKKIDELTVEIDQFLLEVDFCLSEVNAVTKITV